MSIAVTKRSHKVNNRFEMSSGDEDLLLNNLVQTIRSSSALAAQDIDFYKSLDHNINDSLNVTSSQILSLINEVLLSIDQNNDTVDEGKDAFIESWKSISNVMDNLFEKSDHALDNLRKGASNSYNGPEMKYLDDSSRSDSNPSKRIVKPQLKFKTPVDNTELYPFKPLLREKPHSLKPLEAVLKLVPEEEGIPTHYPQPYEFEIDNCEYNDSILKIEEPIPSQPWEDTEAIWVDTVEGLRKMKDQILKARDLAIDLEHHDYRSYYGIVCLMQISDREQDWIVDTIALREELHILNEVFANPSITKIFHGAFMDIIWLQRDLGLYIVSLFDTYHASRLLGFPKHSLAYLLERFAHFKTSKKYQLADWRIRPLNKAMMAYARADTHFLLNIFDQLRNMLLEQNKMAEVLHESRKVAKRRFEYTKFRPKIPSSTVFSPIEKDEPWKNIMFQYNIPLSKELLLRRLYEWRDTIARRDDESPRYVMPNQLLVSLVANAPTEPINVLSVSSFVSDHVRSNSKVLANLIKKTLEDLKQDPSSVKSLPKDTNIDLSRIISTEQIMSLLSMFKSISSHIKEKDNSANPENTMAQSSILFSESSRPANKAILYTQKGKRTIDEKELYGRHRKITETLEKEYTARIVKKIPLPAVTEENLPSKAEVLNDTNEDETLQPEISEAPQPVEDKNEIITLRKRHNYPSKKQREIKTSSTETVDYAVGTNLLNSRKTSSDAQRKPKRKFDPYAVENVGPQPVKKKSKPTKGKNVSFKR